MSSLNWGGFTPLGGCKISLRLRPEVIEHGGGVVYGSIYVKEQNEIKKENNNR